MVPARPPVLVPCGLWCGPSNCSGSSALGVWRPALFSGLAGPQGHRPTTPNSQCRSSVVQDTRGWGRCRLTGSIVIWPDAIQLPRLGRLGPHGAWLSADHRDAGALGHRLGAGGTLVGQPAGAGAAGAGSSADHHHHHEHHCAEWPGGGGRPGPQDAGHRLRWHCLSEPPPRAAPPSRPSSGSTGW